MSAPTPKKAKPAQKWTEEQEENQWRELYSMELTGMRRDLGYITNHYLAEIPGIMTHAAKAVAEVEWILSRIKALQKPVP